MRETSERDDGSNDVLACVEVGGSGCQTIVFEAGGWRALDGAHRPAGAGLAIAVPGIIDGHRVVAASNLGWYDVDPTDPLGLPGPANVVLNDAEAAALGEAALRAAGADGADGADELTDLVFVGLGTGVGGAVVVDGSVVADNLFGHARGFSDRTCRCGQTGCLETVVSGWALPASIDSAAIAPAAAALARAIADEPAATPSLVVVAGGFAGAHPAIVAGLRAALADHVVEPTAAPAGTKSASAWGLRHAVQRAASLR